MNEKSKFVPPEDAMGKKINRIDCKGKELQIGDIVIVNGSINPPNDDVLVWLPTNAPKEVPEQHKKLRYRDYVGQKAKVLNSGKSSYVAEVQTISTKTHPSIVFELSRDSMEKIESKKKQQ